MKTILPQTCVFFTVVLLTVFSLQTNAQTYVTKANGNWTDAATWQGGTVPPTGTISLSKTIKINHSVIYNSSNDINNYGTIRLEKKNNQVPVLTVPSGIKFFNFLTGKVYIKNAEYRQYRFTSMGDNGTAQAGSFENMGGFLSVENSIVEVAQDWINSVGGRRKFFKGKLLIGAKYENKNIFSNDSLIKVSVSLGWHNTGDFIGQDGLLYFDAVKIQLAGTNGKFFLDKGFANGDIDYITFKNHITNATNTGDLEVTSSVNVTGDLSLDAYCVSGPSKYKPNGMISGSQNADCSISYFPSNFMVMQNFALSSGLSFTNPVLVAGTDLQAGAAYKFSNVNDTVDAIVKVDSIVNGAVLNSIDDNTAGTGYSFAFQPRIRSGNITGKSYVVFTIDFLKAGTSTPISLSYVNASPLDIDGGAVLKEFAELSLGSGSAMSYMASSMDITVEQISPGSYFGKNVLGIERANIDTLSFNNMFTVSNTDISSLTIRYGTLTSEPSTATRQFSLYMTGLYYEVTTLPVKLLSFSASLNNSKADLKWTTVSEINVSHFVVERSTDGANYSDAGVVFSYGSAHETAAYTLSDDISGIRSKVIYYRLRSVDIDGKTQLSETRIIHLGKEEANSISLLTYPNPVMNELRITVPDNWQNKQTVFELFNANGQIASRKSTSGSNQTETINTSNLAPGFYIVRVSCEGQIAHQKIIKQ